jgi:hypothetical protein
VADIKSESLAGFASEYLAGLNRNLHFEMALSLPFQSGRGGEA